MIQDVNLTVFYPHPPERVWKAITNRRALATWLMKNDFEPCLGHKFRFQDSLLPGLETTIHCEVIELDEPNRLVYTWRDQSSTEPSLVIWTLTPVEGGTQVQLKHLESSRLAAIASTKIREWQKPEHNPPQMLSGVLNAGTAISSEAGKAIASATVLQHRFSMSVGHYAELNSVLYSMNRHDEWNDRLNRKLPEMLLQLIN